MAPAVQTTSLELDQVLVSFISSIFCPLHDSIRCFRFNKLCSLFFDVSSNNPPPPPNHHHHQNYMLTRMPNNFPKVLRNYCLEGCFLYTVTLPRCDNTVIVHFYSISIICIAGNPLWKETEEDNTHKKNVCWTSTLRIRK